MSEILFNAPVASGDLVSQVDNLQTTLASLNQQVIFLQETLVERDEKIKDLESQLSERKNMENQEKSHTDSTLTIVGVLINLYKFIFPPGKVV